MSKFWALESPAEEAKRAWLLFSESWTQFEDSDIGGPNTQYPISNTHWRDTNGRSCSPYRNDLYSLSFWSVKWEDGSRIPPKVADSFVCHYIGLGSQQCGVKWSETLRIPSTPSVGDRVPARIRSCPSQHESGSWQPEKLQQWEMIYLLYSSYSLLRLAFHLQLPWFSVYQCISRQEDSPWDGGSLF